MSTFLFMLHQSVKLHFGVMDYVFEAMWRSQEHTPRARHVHTGESLYNGTGFYSVERSKVCQQINLEQHAGRFVLAK